MATLLSSELEALKIQDNLKKTELLELEAEDSAVEARLEVIERNPTMLFWSSESLRDSMKCDCQIYLIDYL